MDQATRNVARRGKSLPNQHQARPITKIATGIAGFDEITGGGLPRNRLTAIVGGPGAGKTVFGLQTIVNRLKNAGEPGIFVAFEEPAARVTENVASFDWNVTDLSGKGLRFVDAKIPIDAVLGGAFDLSGLLSSLGQLRA